MIGILAMNKGAVVLLLLAIVVCSCQENDSARRLSWAERADYVPTGRWADLYLEQCYWNGYTPTHEDYQSWLDGKTEVERSLNAGNYDVVLVWLDLKSSRYKVIERQNGKPGGNWFPDDDSNSYIPENDPWQIYQNGQ